MKRINSILLIFIMTLSLILPTTTVVYANSEKEEIKNVVGESNIDSIFSYGNEIKEPEIVTTDGYPAFFYTSMGKWQKKNGEDWEDAEENGVFRAGTWRYKCQVMIEDNNEYGNVTELYKLDTKIEVIVDDKNWEESDTNYNDKTNASTAWVYSQEYVLDEPDNITVFDSNKYDIDTNTVRVPITSISIASAVEGGIKPYTFEKKSGPEWINVSNDGVISGTPNIVNENKNDLVILIKDSSSVNQTEEIKISVGKTEKNPEDREEIKEIKATSNIDSIPVCDNALSKPTITVESGKPAYFSYSEGNWQLKKEVNGEWNWEDVEKGTFKRGIWRFRCKINIENNGDDNAADNYKLAKNVKVKVNEDVWNSTETKYPEGTHRSYTEVYSKEYFITKSGECLVFFETNGGSYIDNIITIEGKKIDKPSDPTKDGYAFAGWYKDKELKNIFNFDKDTIKSHTTLYAKWLKYYTIDAKTSIDGKNESAGEVEGTGRYKDGDKATLKANVDSDFYFECWMEGNNKLSTELTYTFTVNKDRDIKAIVHRLIGYEVSFETYGGTNIPNQTVWTNNPYAIKPVEPKKAGYSFEGWYIDEVYTKAFDFKNKISSDIDIYAKWHKHSTINIAAKSATCKATGNISYYKCKDCNKIFKDSNGTQEITLASTIIQKVAHTPKEEVISKQKTKATLSKNGKIVRTIQEKCSVCGDLLRTKTTTEKIYYPKTIKLSKKTFKYNKKVQKPEVIVKDSNGKIIDTKYYDIKFSNKKSKKVGEYKVTIKFKGNYNGTKELKYTIKPQGTTIKKLKAGSKQFKATWNKNADQTSGYQIQFATNSKFTKNSNKELIEDNKKTSNKFKDLKAKKKYFVRIRTYKTVKGKKIYSSWSDALKVKTKK